MNAKPEVVALPAGAHSGAGGGAASNRKGFVRVHVKGKVYHQWATPAGRLRHRRVR